MQKLIDMKENMKMRIYLATLLLCCTLSSYSQVSGIVYKDFDSNGQRSLPNEIGVRNILVSAFIENKTQPITTRTDINGIYSFSSADIPVGSKVRLEFTNLGIDNSSKKGSDNGSSVQFVMGGTQNANFGIISNEEYCNLNNIEIFTTCYVNGDPLLGGNAGEDASLVLLPYNAEGVAGQNGNPYPQLIAKAKEIGAVWGTEYQRTSRTAIVASIVRRHSGLGPLGTGGLYKVDFVNNITSPLVDLKTLGIDTGLDPHVGLPSNMEIPNEDSLTIHAVGKVGIGGITLSKDEKTLYIVNLFDRKIYSFFIDSPAKSPNKNSVRSYNIPDPCGDGDYRPWAIKQYGNKIYVGVVCSAEKSQDSTKLKGIIYELDPTSGIFSQFFEIPLNYKKGPLDHTFECISYTYWKPWIDKFPKGCASFFDGTYTVNFAMYPAPILADIEFDGDGSLLVGFMDRNGLMAAYRNMRPKDNGQRYDGFIGGDLLRIFNNNGVYQLENNGVAGNRVGSGVGNNQGPGGGEFYGNDSWIFKGNVAHSEILNGGVFIIPGTGEVISSSMDPINEVYQSAGFRVFSNFDGSFKRAYALYTNKIGTLGKSGGTGDLKATCLPAPIEIGNRVWLDSDFDGIQDPNEDGINDIEITLYDLENNGIEVGKTKTKNGGIYCFSNDNVLGGLLTTHQYEIRLKIDQTILINQNVFTGSLAHVNSGSDSELRDSDGILSDKALSIKITTGLAGESNHSFDFGLVKCLSPYAGKDIDFCEPLDSLKLLTAPINQKWMFIDGPSIAKIDSVTGTISNLKLNGDYKFILFYTPVGLSCSDTIVVKRNSLPIVERKTGNDALCFPINYYITSATPTGGIWTSSTNNPSNAVINSLGVITGMNKIGIYEFSYKSVNGCENVAKIELKVCCEKPICIPLSIIKK